MHEGRDAVILLYGLAVLLRFHYGHAHEFTNGLAHFINYLFSLFFFVLPLTYAAFLFSIFHVAPVLVRGNFLKITL